MPAGVAPSEFFASESETVDVCPPVSIEVGAAVTPSTIQGSKSVLSGVESTTGEQPSELSAGPALQPHQLFSALTGVAVAFCSPVVFPANRLNVAVRSAGTWPPGPASSPIARSVPVMLLPVAVTSLTSPWMRMPVDVATAGVSLLSSMVTSLI